MSQKLAFPPFGLWLAALCMLIFTHSAHALLACSAAGLLGFCKITDDGQCLGCCDPATEDCTLPEMDEPDRFIDSYYVSSDACSKSYGAWEACVREQYFSASTNCSVTFTEGPRTTTSWLNGEWQQKSSDVQIVTIHPTQGSPTEPACSRTRTDIARLLIARKWACPLQTKQYGSAWNSPVGRSYCQILNPAKKEPACGNPVSLPRGSKVQTEVDYAGSSD
jgi:hypothetical protein